MGTIFPEWVSFGNLKNLLQSLFPQITLAKYPVLPKFNGPLLSFFYGYANSAAYFSMFPELMRNNIVHSSNIGFL